MHINKGNVSSAQLNTNGCKCHCSSIHLYVFSVDLVALSSLVEVFREQELQQGEHVMDVVEMIHGLTALYERLEEERSILVNIPLCVDMCLNWLLNVYDRWVGRGEMFSQALKAAASNVFKTQLLLPSFSSFVLFYFSFIFFFPFFLLTT